MSPNKVPSFARGLCKPDNNFWIVVADNFEFGLSNHSRLVADRLQVPLDANINIHLGVPERVGDISTAPGRHCIVVPVGVPLNPADLGIKQVVVVELPDQPSAILVNIPVDFLGGVLAGDSNRACFGFGIGVAHV